MKALILNSGQGSRMGTHTVDKPKCLVTIKGEETILSYQLKALARNGVEQVIITTGFYDTMIREYCQNLNLGMKLTFVKNPRYSETNYIYSMECAKELLSDDDILLLHGDLVFAEPVLKQLLEAEDSQMVVSCTRELPEKDFKAVVRDGRIQAVGIEFFESAFAAQPLYLLKREDWKKWSRMISAYCEQGITGCYAENALNEVLGEVELYPFDVAEQFCSEIDNEDDLQTVRMYFGGQS